MWLAPVSVTGVKKNDSLVPKPTLSKGPWDHATLLWESCESPELWVDCARQPSLRVTMLLCPCASWWHAFIPFCL